MNLECFHITLEKNIDYAFPPEIRFSTKSDLLHGKVSNIYGVMENRIPKEKAYICTTLLSFKMHFLYQQTSRNSTMY